MSATVAAFLDRVRERGVELPPPLTGALLLAAVKLSEARSIAVRPGLLQVDPNGGLDLREGAPDSDSPYASPELRTGAVLPDDPRAMVYAAGAFGYELMTLRMLPPGVEAGPEIGGQLAPIVRKALAQDRKKRWPNLAEMARAIELIQAAPSQEEEKLILAAVAQTTGRRKLARAAVQKAAGAGKSPYVADPTPDDAPAQTPAAVHPIFAHGWDPLEAPPEVFFHPPEGTAPPDEPGVVELHEAQVREAHAAEPLPASEPVPLPGPAPRDVRAELREDLLLIESRLENLARIGSRISALEEMVKTSLPPSAPPAVVATRPPSRGLLPAIGGAIGGAAVALLAVIALRPQPATVVSAPAPPPRVAVAVPEVQQPIAERAPMAAANPPPVEARREPEIADPPAAVSRPPIAARKRAVRRSPAAAEHAALGDKALRAFDTAAAETAFETALKEDPALPAGHRGLGMVYVLQGKNDAAKAEYEKYLQLAPDAPDAEQIKRLLAR
ncbi:MAG: tetratricopeptide repeat protein [Myxococcales bacterium]|nr:hypothetical protein [Myxococcales bacterium]